MYGYLKLKANVLQWKTFFGTIDDKRRVLRLSETPCTRCQRAIKIIGSQIQLDRIDTDFLLVDSQGVISQFRATSPIACGMWLAYIKMMIQGIDPRELFVMTPKRVRFNLSSRSIPYSLKIQLTKVAEAESKERLRNKEVERQVFSDFWAEFRQATFYRVRSEIRSQLVGMGFSEDLASEAASQCSGRVERAIEILESPEQLANSEKMFHNKIAVLIENFGYSGDEAEMALSITDGDIDKALETLKEQGVEPRSFSFSYHSAAPSNPADMITQLLTMGFSQEDAAMALNEADGDFKLAVHSLKNRTRLLPETHSNNLAKLLAMGYSPEDAEDALGEAEGDLTNAVELLSSLQQQQASPRSTRADQITKLASLGFSRESADRALQAADGDFGAAVAILESQRRITSMDSSQPRAHVVSPTNTNTDMIKAAASGAAKKLVKLGGGVRDAVQKKLLPVIPTDEATTSEQTPTVTENDIVKDIDITTTHENPFSETDEGADDLSEFLGPAGPEALILSPIQQTPDKQQQNIFTKTMATGLNFEDIEQTPTKVNCNNNNQPADQLCGLDDSTEEATPMDSETRLPFSPGFSSIESPPAPVQTNTASPTHVDPENNCEKPSFSSKLSPESDKHNNTENTPTTDEVPVVVSEPETCENDKQQDSSETLNENKSDEVTKPAEEETEVLPPVVSEPEVEKEDENQPTPEAAEEIETSTPAVVSELETCENNKQQEGSEQEGSEQEGSESPKEVCKADKEDENQSTLEPAEEETEITAPAVVSELETCENNKQQDSSETLNEEKTKPAEEETEVLPPVVSEPEVEKEDENQPTPEAAEEIETSTPAVVSELETCENDKQQDSSETLNEEKVDEVTKPAEEEGEAPPPTAISKPGCDLNGEEPNDEEEKQPTQLKSDPQEQQPEEVTAN